jgi:hypothetical protein
MVFICIKPVGVGRTEAWPITASSVLKLAHLAYWGKLLNTSFDQTLSS